jgi:hypothetical protein
MCLRESEEVELGAAVIVFIVILVIKIIIILKSEGIVPNFS